ncbi:MAG: prepilin peptidase, partial [Geminicoccaceae bacterium]
SFMIGFILFAFNLMGGGDVKLMSGLALWAGVDLVALFLVITGLAGGVMSLCVLLFRRLAEHPLVIVFWSMASVMIAHRLGISFPSKGLEGGARRLEEDPTAGSLPYGVAIAAGGFVVIFTLLKL